MGYYLQLEPDGRIQSAISSNLEQAGATEVDMAVYMQIQNRPSAFRYVDGMIETIPEPPNVDPIPPTISDRQLAHGLAKRELITQAEALNWVGPGILPAAFIAFLEDLPEAQRFDAEMLLRGATQFYWAHPLITKFGTAQGMPPAEIEDLWRFCASQ